MAGKVYLVGAGPGDPELLTVRAHKLIHSVDVILHDDLISGEILRLVPPSTKLENVGKRCGKKNVSQEEINALLVNYAQMGLQVVRLKGGDPSVFGRTGEEMEALRDAGIDFEIVPGVTAAFGAAAAAQIPLTHRDISSSITLITNHHKKGFDEESWAGRIPVDGTVVIYMPGSHHAQTAKKLVDAGLKESTPCAVISKATLEDQQVYLTTIAELLEAPQLPSPALLIVGEVARLADRHAVQFSLDQFASIADTDFPVEISIPRQEFFE